MSALLIFEMQETNGVLLLKANFYTSLFGFATVMVSLTAIYGSLK